MSLDSRIVVLVALFITGCDATADPQPKPATADAKALADAQAHAKAITGGGKQAPACALFTQQEISLMLGAPVSPGETTGPLGTMCQWTGSADPEVHFEIQIIDDISYWGKRSGDPGYEKIAGIGNEAFVVNGLLGSGFDAQAVTDKQIIAIGMTGGSASRDAAVSALRTVVDRISKAGK